MRNAQKSTTATLAPVESAGFNDGDAAPLVAPTILPAPVVVALHVLRAALPHGTAPGPEGELRALAVERLTGYLRA